jgi:hypothetical protein
MAANEAAASDVHVHAHPADLAPRSGKQGIFGRKSARADATPAGVISHLRLVDQESDGKRQTEAAEPGSIFGSALLDELEAGRKAAVTAAEKSDWNDELMSPVDAIRQIAPAKGEASNWIVWSAMTLAGLARALLVSLGYLIARGGETRTRAGVVAGLLTTVIVLSWLAGQAG